MRSLLSALLSIYLIILVGRIVLDILASLSRGRPPAGLVTIYGILYDLTEPVLRPIRRVLPPVKLGSGGRALAFDLSPIVVFFAIGLAQTLLATL